MNFVFGNGTKIYIETSKTSAYISLFIVVDRELFFIYLHPEDQTYFIKSLAKPDNLSTHSITCTFTDTDTNTRRTILNLNDTAVIAVHSIRFRSAGSITIHA